MRTGRQGISLWDLWDRLDDPKGPQLRSKIPIHNDAFVRKDNMTLIM